MQKKLVDFEDVDDGESMALKGAKIKRRNYARKAATKQAYSRDQSALKSGDHTITTYGVDRILICKLTAKICCFNTKLKFLQTRKDVNISQNGNINSLTLPFRTISLSSTSLWHKKYPQKHDQFSNKLMVMEIKSFTKAINLISL